MASYDYQTERPRVLTDDGQRCLLRARDKAFALCAMAGCVRADKVMEASGASDSWLQLAVLDRLVELGDLVEVSDPGTRSQHRVFRRALNGGAA